MKKFNNPCGYGIDPETTREEVIEYAEELEIKVDELEEWKRKVENKEICPYCNGELDYGHRCW